MLVGLCMLAAATVRRSRDALLRSMWVVAAPVPHSWRTRGSDQEALRLGVAILFLIWVMVGGGLVAIGLSRLGFEAAAATVFGLMLVGSVSASVYIFWPRD